MALVNKPFTFSAGATIVASEHNSNFDTVYNAVNGGLDNTNVTSGANIALNKLNTSDAVTWSGLHTHSGSGQVIKATTSSETASAIGITCTGSGHPLQLVNTGDGPHMRWLGDPTITNPKDGDMWYDGTNWLGYDGSGTKRITGGSKIGTTSIAIDDVPGGTMKFTGVGFKPTSLNVNVGSNRAGLAAWGFGDATSENCTYWYNHIAADEVNSQASLFVVFETNASMVWGMIDSFDEDGFTLDVRKASAMGGAANVVINWQAIA